MSLLSNIKQHAENLQKQLVEHTGLLAKLEHDRENVKSLVNKIAGAIENCSMIIAAMAPETPVGQVAGVVGTAVHAISEGVNALNEGAHNLANQAQATAQVVSDAVQEIAP